MSKLWKEFLTAVDEATFTAKGWEVVFVVVSMSTGLTTIAVAVIAGAIAILS